MGRCVRYQSSTTRWSVFTNPEGAEFYGASSTTRAAPPTRRARSRARWRARPQSSKRAVEDRFVADRGGRRGADQPGDPPQLPARAKAPAGGRRGGERDQPARAAQTGKDLSYQLRLIRDADPEMIGARSPAMRTISRITSATTTTSPFCASRCSAARPPSPMRPTSATCSKRSTSGAASSSSRPSPSAAGSTPRSRRSSRSASGSTGTRGASASRSLRSCHSRRSRLVIVCRR
jgi:hypothetical protein